MTSPPTIFEHYRPGFARRVGRAARWFGERWFHFRIDGVENIPSGPCLFVGNHSGFGIVEEVLLLSTWQQHFPTRRAWGLIHDVMFKFPVLGRYYRAIGAVPASRDNARAAFARGDSVLVFPGGDLDCCRPFYEPHCVHFGPRRGYARLAIEQGVPIVPIATSGSHWTWTFLPGGRTLARIPWVRRTFRTDCVPLPAGLFAVVIAVLLAALHLDPWWTVAVVVLLAALPTPVPVHTVIGEPIDTTALRATTHAVEHLHDDVVGWLRTTIAPSAVSVTESG